MARRVSIKDSDFLQKARARYKLAIDAEDQQVQREHDDIQFEDGQQWNPQVLLARQGQQPVNGTNPIPARPTLVINKIREPIQNTLNQVRQADIGAQIVPAEDFGDLGILPDETEIALREGLLRRIQRESHAQDARMWAFKRALIAGRGYYFVMLRYLPGKTFDQEVVIERIYHQESVTGDPSRQKPDGSDSDYWFIGTWVPWDRFSAEYPFDVDHVKNPFSDASESDFTSMAESYPDWYKQDGEQRAVRVVAYWYTERLTTTYALLDDGRTVLESEVPEGVEPRDVRTDVQKTIKFSRIAGGVLEVEHTDWAGPDMPVIQVLGNEVIPYDNQKRFEGMVRPARDAQQGENYMISKFVETVGLAPISPLIVDPDAIDGFESEYQVSNTRALPVLHSRTYDDYGRELREPHRPSADPNILPMAQGIALFDQFIRSTTTVPDSTLGNVDPSLKSARAINAVVANAQTSTSGYTDNLAVSVSYEGKVVNNLLYPIYGVRPGRLVRIITGEGEGQMMQIGGDPNQQRAMPIAKLTQDANFNVIVKITRNSESRRAQFVQMFGQILEADPQQMAVAGDLFYRNMDIPEAQQLAKRQRIMLAPPVQQFLAAQEQNRPYDPVAQAQLADATQKLQQQGQLIAELAPIAKGKQAEYRAKIDSEQLAQDAETQRRGMDNDKEIRLQAMKDATSIRVAEINAQAKIGTEADANTLEAFALQSDREQAQLDRQHDQHMADRDLAAQLVTTAPTAPPPDQAAPSPDQTTPQAQPASI